MAAGDKVKQDQKNNNKLKNIKNGILPHKEFKPRNSVLIDLFEIDHFKSIRHCFVAVAIIVIMNTFICDVLESGSLSHAARYIIIGFAQFPKVIIIWTAMFACTSLVYVVFSIWAQLRMKLNPKSFFVRLWDRFWLVIFLIYLTIFLYIPPYLKCSHDLPIGSAAVVLAEQIRMFMKTHAFVRSNVPSVRSFKPHSQKNYPVPTFSKYLYYMFIPTFVYRDEYPRTKQIRWWFVIMNFSEVLAVICFYNFITINYLVPDFKNFGLEPITWRVVTVSIFRMILPSSMIMLSGFYLILHSWLNAWAEMLKFADRLFYLDWWNTANFSAYYRKWNIVVHDYLHAYIYRDMYEIVTPGNKLISTLAVFITSAVVHEYIIGFMLGFFFPVMFLQFISFGMLLVFIKIKDRQFIGNIFMWWSLSVGVGLQITLYTMEYNARINCPKDIDGFSDFFVPRFLYCNNKYIV